MEGDEMTADEFDVVVIGAGPAGEVCSGRLGEAGLSVAVVEGHLVGGECSFYGCMPSKALLRPAEALAEAQRIPGAREAVTGRLDVEAVLSRRDEVIHDLDDSVQLPWLEQRGVTVLRGHARLAGERRVQLHGGLIRARRAVVLATGIEVRIGSPAVEISRNGHGVSVRLDGGEELEADELLVAVGRRPATRDLGLESVGLEPGRYVEVDETLRVAGHDWLFAIGDANGRALLTHMGKYQGRIAADVILGRDAKIDPRADGPLAPRVVFTEPQVAAVGHTLASALEAGIDARAVDVETSSNAGGSFYGRGAAGISRLVVDGQQRILVGATFTGPDVSEFVHAATIAIVAEVPLEKLWHATPSFPTRSEVWLKLLEAYGL